LGGEFQSAFWAAKRAMTTAAEAAYNRHGVRAGQQFILHQLWEEDGLAPGEVARRLDLAVPTVTRAATRMEAAGILRREPHPSDARLVRLCLTDRGRELKEIMTAEIAQLSERALRTLDAAERERFTHYLNEVRNNLV
jgi:DNA-binding MarR family transcriptional regulator